MHTLALSNCSAHECGPLSTAICKKSISKLCAVLSKDPRTISEKNNVSETPLHLACNWPDGLRILLEQGSAVTIHEFTESYDLPLDYAIMAECSEAILLLLQYGGRLTKQAAGECFVDEE